MKIKCNVWCSETTEHQQELLGLPEGDIWAPFVFDLSKVTAIKLCGPNDFIGDDKTTIYFYDIPYTIDMQYNDLVGLFLTL